MSRALAVFGASQTAETVASKLTFVSFRSRAFCLAPDPAKPGRGVRFEEFWALGLGFIGLRV